MLMVKDGYLFFLFYKNDSTDSKDKGIEMSLTQTASEEECIKILDYLVIKTKQNSEIIVVNFSCLSKDILLRDYLVGCVLLSTKEEYGVFMKTKKAWLRCWYLWLVVMSILSACLITFHLTPKCH
jgi:hypothetical protein